MSIPELPQNPPPVHEDDEYAAKKPLFKRIPVVGGLLSIVPGLGQAYSGYILRGILLFFFILSLYAVSVWRLVDVEALSLTDGIKFVEDWNKEQTQALNYVVLAVFLTTLAYLWNIYDGYSCAGGKCAPAKIAIYLISIANLLIGAHITQFDIGKAWRDRADLGNLEPILWPWDTALFYREEDTTEGIAYWYSPCNPPEEGQELTPEELEAQALDPEIYEQPDPEDAGEASLIITPLCGVGAGLRQPNGQRATPGTTLHLTGSGFIPGEDAEIVIQPGAGREFRVVVESERVIIVPDENGNFESEFEMPNMPALGLATSATRVTITVRQSREIGPPLLTQTFKLAFEGIIITVFLALMATVAGIVLAVPVSFLAAKNLMSTNRFVLAIYYVVRLILNIIRSIEPLVWAIVAIIWVGPGPFAGVIALTVHTIASLGKLYSEAIESIDPGPIEAIQATGGNRLQTIMHAVVPQVIPPFVSFTIYRWDINVRMSTIIGAVGGGGIGEVFIQWFRLGDYDAVGIAVWMIAIVVTLMDYASARIREKYV